MLGRPEEVVEQVGQDECQGASEISVEEVDEGISKDACNGGMRMVDFLHSRNT